ncbi:MAG TPA: triphosphoribosyl-dephospho-CoA synthase [Gemmatimonadales bacterium]|nr:triphosphoribosyl-dephospho-CoA synthase [Gemmatimonadales bacterium]
MTLSPADVSAYATLACLLEASAPKPGNVSPGRPFRDMAYEDFLASAVAIGPVLAQAGQRPLGETIRDALRATRRWTGANTNLGIVLLLTPLARAELAASEGTLRERLGRILRATTVPDAVEVYGAIQQSGAGGLGRVEQEDLAGRPTVTLREAMALAAGRDAIAAEYVSDFEFTFTTGLPTLRAARQAALSWDHVVLETFLTLLAAKPDTLIARKLGAEAAEAVTRRAAEVQALGGVRTEAGLAELARFDAELRHSHNSRNPGTTADLTAAALFVALLEDGWRHER